MAVDEQARHRLYRRLEEVLGEEEAGILMDHLPPTGFGDLATKGDIGLVRADLERLRESSRADLESLQERLGSRMETLEHKLTGQMDRAVRRVVQWTSSTVLVGIGLAIAAGRLV